MPDNQYNVPDGLKPLGVQPDGSVVFGQSPDNHYDVAYDAGQPVFNDSGIELDSTKFLSMPGGGNVAMISMGEEWRPDGIVQTITFDVPWSIRIKWLAWCLGYETLPSEFFAGLPWQTFNRVPPVQHPEMPWLYASDAKLVEAMGVPLNRDDIVLKDSSGHPVPASTPGGQIEQFTAIPGEEPPPQYAYAPAIKYAENAGDGDFTFRDGVARYQVTYTHRLYQILSDDQLHTQGGGEFNRYVTKNKNYAVMSYPVPATGTQLKFSDPAYPAILGTQIGVGILVIQPTEQLEYTWHDVPWYSEQAIQSAAGHINAGVFDGRPPETLLFQAPKITRKRNRVGRYVWDIVMRMDFKPFGWNTYLTKQGTAFVRATFGGAVDGPTVYTGANFYNCFNPSFGGGPFL